MISESHFKDKNYANCITHSGIVLIIREGIKHYENEKYYKAANVNLQDGRDLIIIYAIYYPSNDNDKNNNFEGFFNQRRIRSSQGEIIMQSLELKNDNYKRERVNKSKDRQSTTNMC